MQHIMVFHRNKLITSLLVRTALHSLRLILYEELISSCMYSLPRCHGIIIVRTWHHGLLNNAWHHYRSSYQPAFVQRCSAVYTKPMHQQWRIQGEIPGCHGSPLSVYSYVALVQLLASYLSVFVAIVVWFNDCTCCFDVSTVKRVFQVNFSLG